LKNQQFSRSNSKLYKENPNNVNQKMTVATMADATMAATTMKGATMDNQSTHLQ